jgi:hypothetical protein
LSSGGIKLDGTIIKRIAVLFRMPQGFEAKDLALVIVFAFISPATCWAYVTLTPAEKIEPFLPFACTCLFVVCILYIGAVLFSWIIEQIEVLLISSCHALRWLFFEK